MIEGPIVLVGLMATGKSTVGRALASRLHRRFLDSDAVIEQRTGHTVAQIFRADGEPAFRALETQALTEALEAQPPAVVAAAGGTVLSEHNRALLQRVSATGGRVIWLRARPEVLATRVRPGDHRPLLAEDPAGTLLRMFQNRSPLYAEVADRIVDVDECDIPHVIAAVEEALN